MKKIISLFLITCIMLSAFMFSASAADEAESPIDLAVTGTGVNTSTVYDGDKVDLFATVRNMGSVAVKGNFSVIFYIDGKLIQTVVGRVAVSAGAMKNISTTIDSRLMFGTHRITAEVNPENQLGETNLSNNKIKKRIQVSDDLNPNPNTAVPPDAQSSPVKESSVLRIEAENCKFYGDVTVKTEIPDYSGKGYALVQKAEGTGIGFTFNAPEDGNYRISIRMGNGTSDRNTFILTTGSSYKLLTLGALRYWNVWSTVSGSFNLTKGSHTFTFLTNSVVQNEVTMDYVEIRQTMSEISSFSFSMEKNENLHSNVSCSISENRITALVPDDTDVSNLIADFTTSAASVKVSGVEQESGVTANNFINGQYYDCYDEDGNLIRRYTVVFDRVENTNLPNVFANITSADPSSDLNILLNGSKADKDHDVTVDISVIANTSTNLFQGDSNFADIKAQPGTIHIRGNSTAGFKKKSYKIKFDSKQTVLDMDNNKHWVLNANHDDKTMMRQYIGFEIARVLDGMAYSPKWRFVNFYLDGKYMGVYIIGQNIRQGKNRVDITEMKENATDITGGYIIELDGRQDDLPELMFDVTSVLGTEHFTLVEPDEDIVTEAHIEYISTYLTTAFESLRDTSTGEYEKYFDIDSFVDWYVCAEICKVNDWHGFTSVYIYKDAKDDKLYAGPVWDFLPGLGNCTNGGIYEPEGLTMNSMWYSKLKNAPGFMDKVKERYKYFRENYDMLSLIREMEEYLDVAQKDNYDRWGTLVEDVWPNRTVFNTYGEYVDEFYTWYDTRLKWLDEQWLED